MTKQKNIKGILFDFNGTLYFDSPLHIEAFKRYFVAHGKPEPDDEFATKKIFGRDNYTIYTDNFNPNPTDEEYRQYVDDKEGLYRALCLEDPEKNMQYVKGACEMLDFLKENGIPYCLATGSGMENVEFYLTEMKLDRWFTLDNIVYFDGSFKGKPQPDSYILAAKRLGLSPSECVVFEDGPSGMLAANRAGAGAVICVYEDYLPSPVTDDVKCDGVYHDFTKWREIFKNLGILR